MNKTLKSKYPSSPLSFGKLKKGLALAAMAAGLASSLHAAADWYANPDASGASWDDYFKNFNTEDYTGTKPSAAIATDSTYGKVWCITKPSGAKRAEFSRPTVNGSDFNFVEGTTYYIGFRARFDVISPTTFGNDEITVFQWKTDGNGDQNYPFNMEWNPSTSKLSLNLFGPGAQYSQSSRRATVWQGTVNENQWVTIVIGFKFSTDPNVGWVSIWKNGSKQVLSDISHGTRYSISKFSSDSKAAYHRTKDTGYNYAKFGIYNESSRIYEIKDYRSDLRIDTSYSEARPQ